MIMGAHAILFSKDSEADRAFFKDVLKYRFADAGHGWLIFALPPAEIAFHPSNADEGEKHELYLMCDDVNAFVAEMAKKGIATSPLHEERWGILTHMTLPSGAQLGVYEPKHASPLLAKGRAKKGRAARKRAAKKSPKAGAKRGVKSGATKAKKRGRSK